MLCATAEARYGNVPGTIGPCYTAGQLHAWGWYYCRLGAGLERRAWCCLGAFRLCMEVMRWAAPCWLVDRLPADVLTSESMIGFTAAVWAQAKVTVATLTKGVCVPHLLSSRAPKNALRARSLAYPTKVIMTVTKRHPGNILQSKSEFLCLATSIGLLWKVSKIIIACITSSPDKRKMSSSHDNSA